MNRIRRTSLQIHRFRQSGLPKSAKIRRRRSPIRTSHWRPILTVHGLEYAQQGGNIGCGYGQGIHRTNGHKSSRTQRNNVHKGKIMQLIIDI